MGKKIVDAKKDSEGNINSVRFRSNKNFTDIKTAKRMAKRGQIDNVHIVKQKTGKTYLRTNPDNKKSNNLDDMAE